jgi:hypothetical protein
VQSGEFGFRVEQVHLARAAVLEQDDDAFSPSRMMGRLEVSLFGGLEPAEGH